MFFNRSQQSQQIQSKRVRDRISSNVYCCIHCCCCREPGPPPAAQTGAASGELRGEELREREELWFPEACMTRSDVSRPGPGVGVSGVWCQVLRVTAVRRWWSAADLGASNSLGPASHSALAGCKLQLLLSSLKRNRSFRTLFYFCDKLEETPIIVNLGK